MRKEINGHENYFINENGIVTNNDGNYIRISCSSVEGNLYVRIDNENANISKLVAEAFIPNDDPENKKFINHIDHDIFHNHVSNLQWSEKDEKEYLCSYFDNIKKYSPKSKQSSCNKNIIPYEVFNDSEVIECKNRFEVANLIQYELMSLKNMIGNGRIITKGPYIGYQIRRKNNNLLFTNCYQISIY